MGANTTTLPRLAATAAVLGAVWSGAGPASAQSPSVDDLGRSEYQSACASCHGADGKGGGPLRGFLVKPPADLTTLASRNGGALPTQLVWEMIDGRTLSGSGPHGSREMPVWGATYRAEALASPTASKAPEWYVRGRIVALIDYLQRIQAK